MTSLLPGTTPSMLQAHLYSSFLQGKVSDITLSVQGTWEAKYRLHRVVLIQAGFFCSLFTAGFAESASNGGTGLDEVEVVFDDRNITRAAFEICIARLYGGGPPLYVPPSLIPTPTQPLTPGWMATAPLIDPPPGYHPATPRFLLSLLATALYLSIPSVASQALTLILGSVGPYTVMDYLNFALGKPIDGLAYDDPIAAVGLEEITHDVSTARIGDDKHQDASKQKESSFSCHSTYSHAVADGHTSEPLFLYGTVSNKIGEAAACWLARWGPDILPLELRRSEVARTQQSTFASSASLLYSASEQSMIDRSEISGRNIPVIWARGGLNAQWISALISSDVLFIRGERERYEFAKSIVELRRRDGLEETEEREWERMFRQGIYYINMPTEDVIAISQEISPTTGRPYVPMAILQSANWNQSVLRSRITSKSLASAMQGPQRDKELGITVTTADMLSSVRNGASNQQQEERVYYHVPTDCSTRLGENGKIEATAMDQLFETSSVAYNPKGASAINSRPGTCEANFFGLQSECPVASSCIDSDPTGASQWSPYPPFRFAVEFWGVHNLREKVPLHSQTIWYAGSFFNVYVQLVRKKGTQLGVYLHRQSSIDPLPVPSSPTARLTRAHINSWTSEFSASRAGISTPPSTPPSVPAGPSRSTTPVSHGRASPSTPAVALQSSARVAPVQPYRDPRSSVSVYFSIACASATGASLTQFTSAPDVFTVGQSWGWKSSSLIAEGYADVGADDVFGREVSLRATVVLGVV